MYMNGRGGYRGPAGGPMHHRPMGFGPGMGFRPMMRTRYRPMGLFPMGGLFILPALMFGGWIAVAVIGGVLSLIGTILGGIFSGLSSLASGAFSGSGLVIGIILGLIAFRYFRNRNAKKEEKTTGTIDGREVETTIVEPVEYSYRRMGE